MKFELTVVIYIWASDETIRQGIKRLKTLVIGTLYRSKGQCILYLLRDVVCKTPRYMERLQE